MSLPILNLPPPPPDNAALVRYFHQTERHWTEHLVEAAMAHLDDPHYDALLALKDGQAVAKVGVLAVGEIGRIEPMFVAESSRRQGIGRAMMLRALEICARSLFKHVFLSCMPDN